MTQTEIQTLAHELAKALAPLLKQTETEEGTQLPDGTLMRAALRDCHTFSDADRRLAHGGIASAGKRRALIARHSPKLFNALMRQPYTG